MGQSAPVPFHWYCQLCCHWCMFPAPMWPEPDPSPLACMPSALETVPEATAVPATATTATRPTIARSTDVFIFCSPPVLPRESLPEAMCHSLGEKVLGCMLKSPANLCRMVKSALKSGSQSRIRLDLDLVRGPVPFLGDDPFLGE